MRIYDTDREINELRLIKEKAERIINPNGDIKWSGSMTPYLKAVKDSEAVYCSEYKDHIGHGVFVEVETALKHNIPVFVIRGDKTKKVVSVKTINRDDWKVKYGKIVTE